MSISVLTLTSFGVEAEDVGDDLRQHGAMALPLRHRGDVNGDAADRIEAYGRGGLRAVLRPRLAALGRRQHGRDIAHVGDAGLDDRSKADAVETPLRARLVAARLQFGELSPFDRRERSLPDSCRNRATRRVAVR